MKRNSRNLAAALVAQVFVEGMLGQVLAHSLYILHFLALELLDQLFVALVGARRRVLRFLLVLALLDHHLRGDRNPLGNGETILLLDHLEIIDHGAIGRRHFARLRRLNRALQYRITSLLNIIVG